MGTISIEQAQAARPSAAARLDRLPIGSFHRKLMWLIAVLHFFETADINTFAFAAPVLRRDWGLSMNQIGMVTSAVFVGMFVGATTGGWFADRLGRKKALLAATAFNCTFALLNAFVWNLPTLVLTRFLTGVGISAMQVIGMTYVVELYPARRRGTFQALVMSIGLFSVPLTATIAHRVIPLATWGWRLVFVWGSLGMLILLFSNLLVESPRWYENHGRLAEAEALLERIEAQSKAEFGALPPVGESPAPVQSRRYRSLFTGANRPRTIMLLAVWISQTLGFYGFLAWVPTLLVARGFPLVQSLGWVSAMHIGAPFGAMLAALISDRWERKHLITAVTMLIAFCGIMYGMAFNTLSIMIFGFSVSLLMQIFAALLHAYTPECFPTAVRSSGSGLTFGIGRLANGFGPFIIAYVFTHFGYRPVFGYIATLWVITGLIIGIFGPKTKGRTLA